MFFVPTGQLNKVSLKLRERFPLATVTKEMRYVVFSYRGNLITEEGVGGRKQLKLSYLCVFCEYLLTMVGATSHLISLDDLYIFSTMVAFVLVFTNGMEWHSTLMYIIETSVQIAWNTSCMKVWNFFLTTSSYACYYVSWELLHITLLWLGHGMFIYESWLF